MEILRTTPWSRIREQNSVYKEFLEIVGNGKPTGNVWKETIAVSATIWISVGKVAPSNPSPNSFMRQSERKPSRTRSPRGRAPAVECLDGLARITSEELAVFHFVKNGTLQNACTTRPRVVVGLCKSAHSHIVRLMNSRRKGLNEWWQKCLWLYWRREIGKKENLSPMGRGVIRNWDKIHTSVFWCTTIGLRISGHEAAEVYSPEGHRHAETNPTCEVHKGYCSSYQNSRPKSLARLHLSRWTSWA